MTSEEKLEVLRAVPRYLERPTVLYVPFSLSRPLLRSFFVITICFEFFLIQIQQESVRSTKTPTLSLHWNTA